MKSSVLVCFMAILVFALSSVGTRQASAKDAGDTKSAVVRTTGIDGHLVVGIYKDADGNEHGFIYDTENKTWVILDKPSDAVNTPNAATGVMTNTSDMTGATRAMGISGGIVVGSYTNSSGEHGFIYDVSKKFWTTLDKPEEITYTPNPKTNTVTMAIQSNTATRPTGISGNSIVGTYTNEDGDHSFVYDMSKKSWATLEKPKE